MERKIDFTVLITATNANPNGDPLNGNRPRESYDGYGEISDVCIKRKLRDRLQDMGEPIFVQSADRCTDGFDSLHTRAAKNPRVGALMNGKATDGVKLAEASCAEWLDVRAFGQLFAFKGTEVSLGIRGAVAIQSAVSVSPIDVREMQITKSVNSESAGNGKASDTMGMKYSVPFALYVLHGSINCQLADKNGFTDEDAQKIKQALCTMFENDSSAARPEGSMEVCRVYWWEHDCKTPSISSAKVHRAVQVTQKPEVAVPRKFDDYDIELKDIGIAPEVINLM